ncbi:paired amphipathic helix [Schizophyllum commune]|nr:PAH2 domain-containing protein [Schizophyllum commune Loenen D]
MSPPPPSPPPGLDVDVTDALHYLDAVKARFRDQPEAYKEFLGVLSALKTGEIDLRQCVERVVEMLRGYPELIVGFNVFLPRGAILDPNTGAIVQLPDSA